MNTGVQRSTATPPAARTATTMAVGAEPGNVFGQGKNVPRDRDGARHSLRRDRDRRRPARPRGQGAARDGIPRRALHPHPRALPARLGHGVATTRSASRAWPWRRACSRCSRPSTARSPRVSKIRRQLPVEEYLQAAEALRAPVRHAAARGRDRAHPGDRRPQHPPVTACCDGGTHDAQALRHHARPRLEPRQPHRLAGAPSGRSTSTACRRATTPAPRARTSRAGSTTPRPATTRPPGAC